MKGTRRPSAMSSTSSTYKMNSNLSSIGKKMQSSALLSLQPILAFNSMTTSSRWTMIVKDPELRKFVNATLQRLAKTMRRYHGLVKTVKDAWDLWKRFTSRTMAVYSTSSSKGSSFTRKTPTARSKPSSIDSNPEVSSEQTKKSTAMELSLDAELIKVRNKLRAASYTSYGSDFEKLFKEIDIDHSGTISLSELGKEIRRLVPGVTRENLQTLMIIADSDGNGELDCEEFANFIDPNHSLSRISSSKSQAVKARSSTKKKTVITAEELKKIRAKLLSASYTSHGSDPNKLFDEIDKNHGGSIDLKELSREIKRLVPWISEDKMQALMKIADSDGNGELDRGEFANFIDPTHGAHSTASDIIDAGGNKTLPAVSAAEIRVVRSKLLASSFTAYGSDLEKLFHEIDVDHSGTISVNELGKEIRRLIPSVTEAKLRTLMKIADSDGSGELGYKEFACFIDPEHGFKSVPRQLSPNHKRLPKVSAEEIENVRHKLLAASYASSGGNDFKKLFDRIDTDHNGTIDLRELGREVKKLVPGLSDGKVQSLLKIADTDGNGELDLQEFISFIDHRQTLQALIDRGFKEDEIMKQLTSGMGGSTSSKNIKSEEICLDPVVYSEDGVFETPSKVDEDQPLSLIDLAAQSNSKLMETPQDQDEKDTVDGTDGFCLEEFDKDLHSFSQFLGISSHSLIHNSIYYLTYFLHMNVVIRICTTFLCVAFHCFHSFLWYLITRIIKCACRQ